jgi:hypothetical protein
MLLLLSEKTLEKIRDADHGPKYTQGATGGGDHDSATDAPDCRLWWTGAAG